MTNVHFRFGLGTAMAALCAVGISQMLSIPQGWSNKRADGLIILTPPETDTVMMFFAETLGEQDLNSWSQWKFPELNRSQVYHLRAMNGQPIDVVMGNQKGTDKVFIATSTPSQMGTKIAGFSAPDSPLASRYLAPLAKATDQWIGMRTQSANSSSNDGLNAATAGASATGNHVNAGATSVAGPGGASSSSYSSSSSSDQSSSNDSHSSQDSKTDKSSQHDANSQTSKDSMTSKDSKASKDSKSDKSSQSQSSKDAHQMSDSQIVYDPGTHGFKVAPGTRTEGKLSGSYSYVSDLFAAPIGTAKSAPQTQSQVMFGPRGFTVAGPGARAEGSLVERDGDMLILHFKNGEVLRTPMRVLDVADGAVRKFAIGPCVYTRNSS